MCMRACRSAKEVNGSKKPQGGWVKSRVGSIWVFFPQPKLLPFLITSEPCDFKGLEAAFQPFGSGEEGYSFLHPLP